MAQGNGPSGTPQSNDDLQSIQHNLFNITEQYKQQNKLLGINSNETRQTVTATTNLGKILGKVMETEAKIGKEILKRKNVENQLKSLAVEYEILLKRSSKTYADLTRKQQKQVDLIDQQFAEQRSLSKQMDQSDSDHLEYKEKWLEVATEILALEDKSEQASQRYLDLQKELLKVEQLEKNAFNERVQSAQKYVTLSASIADISKNQAVSTALIQREQVSAAKSALNLMKSLPQEVEDANKKLRKGMFWKQLLSRVPILDQFADSAKHLEDFGVKGAVVLGVVGAVGLALAKIVEMMFKADSQITDIQKGFGATKDDAKFLRQYFYEVVANADKFAKLQDGTLLTEKDIYEAQGEFNKAFGTAVVMSGQQLAQLAKVKDIIGLSEESMKGLMTYSLGSGKAIDDIDTSVLGTSKILQLQKGIQLSNKDILESVYKVTGGIRANFKGNVEELTKAVTQAKLYGTSLEQVQHTSDSLLDFESSIENQLEAELLTGKQINLERARAAALAGDTNTVMSEMVKEAGNFDQFMKYNVITQNSLAKAFGMSRDEMSDMLFQQKALEGLRKAGNKEEQKSIVQRYDDLVRLGKTHDELVQALGQTAEATLSQQSAQQKFQKVIEKFEDAIGRLFEGDLLNKVLSGLAGIAKYLTEGGNIGGVLFGSDAYHKAQADVAGQLHDGVVSPKGAIMISTPRGQIATDPKDSIIATTNPGGVLGGGAGGGSTSRIEDKLDKLIEVISKGGNVYMDAKKVGTTMAIAYSANA